VGFIFVPLIKFYPFRGLVPYRPEQGFGWDGRAGRWLWELVLMGEDGSQSTLGLERPRGIAGRAQTPVGRLLLGLNVANRTVHWYGLDGRYSVPEWVLRAEAFKGSGGGAEIYGYYLDALYHPRALPRWTFLGRAEAVHGVLLHRRYTLGARVVLRSGLTLSANWIDNRVRFPSNAGGVNIQLQQTLQY
jgi:hypothetical protein